jgi:hypothetical protein
MMSTLATEALATLQEAERLLAALRPTSPDYEATALLAADLRDICATLTDTLHAAGANLARAREIVYGAKAHLRIIRARQERSGST